MRFLREAYALSSLHHPHIVHTSDFGVAEGRFYYAMHEVSGPTLYQQVERHGPATPEQALAMVKALASALEAMDEVDLLHRDLTPANVILRHGRWDQPVLIDFGLAKRSYDRGLTLSELLLGTPGYIAPERVEGHVEDARSDLFSLGLLARFAATGEEPFPELCGMRRVSHMAHHQVEIPANLPSRLRGLLDQLTRLSPHERPQSAACLLEMLQAELVLVAA